MPPMQKKICLLGDFAVGKTSLVRRFVEGIFEDKYLSTIGTKVNRKALTVQDRPLLLLLWDLAGGERFDHMMSSYYRGAAGAILVCDVTRLETLDILHRYVEDFWGINPHTPLVIVGNKVDLVAERTVEDLQLATFAEQHQASWFTSSAKTGANVEALFMALGHSLIQVK